MRLSLCKCYSFPTHWSLKSSFNVGVIVRCWRPASPRGLPSWHHSHYLCVCMLLFQFSSHWAANNLKQQGYSLTTLSVESPCRPPPDLSPAREAASECVHVCTHMCACVRVWDYSSLHVIGRWNVWEVFTWHMKLCILYTIVCVCGCEYRYWVCTSSTHSYAEVLAEWRPRMSFTAVINSH